MSDASESELGSEMDEGRSVEELAVVLVLIDHIRKNTLSLEHPRKYSKGCPNTI